MKSILRLHFLILLLTILGCKDSKTSEEEKALEKQLAKKQEVYDESEFVIDGIYGTSTEIPLLKNHAVNVLDGNTETSWKTLQGAGPNEGVMIYFNKPIYIKKINIIQAKGEAITKVDEFDVYANSKVHSIEKINSTVEALFIRVKEVTPTDVRVNKFTIEGDRYFKATNTTFSSKHSVAISEIEFFDDSENKIEFVIPKLIKASIASSSTLTPEVAYSASNLFDCKKDFGWSENVAGNGINESITINTDDVIEYNKIKIWNGYQRSSAHFNANGSVKKLHIKNVLTEEKGDNTTKLDQILDLENAKVPQAYNIKNRVPTNMLTLTLKDIYKGQRYEDILMSEIRLYEKNTPLILLSSEAETVIKVNREKKESNKVLQYVLDKNIKVDVLERKGVEDTFFNYNKEVSFTLRSNNSFVIYTTESQGYDNQKQDFSSQTIADGNWELLSKEKGAIKVRIFGRLYDVYDGVDTYKGKEKKESTKIFKDVITITMDFIEGEKFIDKIQLR